MCLCVGEINMTRSIRIGINIDDKIKTPSFKPGLADKRIFMEIINTNIPALEYDFNVRGFNLKHLAYGLMLNYYYPYYG